MDAYVSRQRTCTGKEVGFSSIFCGVWTVSAGPGWEVVYFGNMASMFECVEFHVDIVTVLNLDGVGTR
jgi:hypothetical protein